MKPLRSFLDRLEPLFTKGGRFEQFYALFEAVDTFFYSPPDLTRGSPHVRDALDLKRVMILVVIASTPAAVMGMWNVGFQANAAMQNLGIRRVPVPRILQLDVFTRRHVERHRLRQRRDDRITDSGLGASAVQQKRGAIHW